MHFKKGQLVVNGRPATPMFWKVKWLFLAMESGCFGESDITSVSCCKMLSDGNVKHWNYSKYSRHLNLLIFKKYLLSTAVRFLASILVLFAWKLWMCWPPPTGDNILTMNTITTLKKNCPFKANSQTGWWKNSHGCFSHVRVSDLHRIS